MIIQVAGVKNADEARMLMDCGVEYLGFPLRLDVNKPDLPEEEAARIIRSLPRPHKGVLITYMNKASEIADFMNFLGAGAVQLHGSVEEGEVAALRRRGPDFFIIKSLVVRDGNAGELAEDVKRFSPFVDAFITDTFNPKTGASGATGMTHDWSVSRELVKVSKKPVILAGGLKPSNVREAILEVRPAGVDVHTGVENKNGDKDPELVGAFVKNSIEAFKLI